jgi:hypothetical protein
MTSLIGHHSSQNGHQPPVDAAPHTRHQLVDRKRHPLQYDVLADHTGKKIPLVHFVEQQVGETDKRWARQVFYGVAELLARHPQVVEPLRKNLDMAGFVDRLSCQKTFAGLIRCGIDEARGSGKSTALGKNELNGREKRPFPQYSVIEYEFGLALRR